MFSLNNLFCIGQLNPLLISICLFSVLTSGCTNDDDLPEPAKPGPDLPSYPTCTLLGSLSFSEPIQDITGYVDAQTSREYALVGFGEHCHSNCEIDDATGVYIVDVTDPSSPTLIETIHTVNGFDLKTYKHYLYVVNGEGEGINNDHRGTIYDIQDLSNPKKVGGFPSSHNAFIDEEKGLLVTSLEGLNIYDIKTNPERPTLLWSSGDARGHDATIVGDWLYDFHEYETNIYNISDPESPRLITKINPPPSTIQYHHSGWPTEDGNYLIINDEGVGAFGGNDITIWDISIGGLPRLAYKYNNANSIVHNVQVVGDKAYFSFYTAGIQVFDISNPESPVILCQYDTSPRYNVPTFNGAWGIYAFMPSGNILISDVENGLFIFSP